MTSVLDQSLIASDQYLVYTRYSRDKQVQTWFHCTVAVMTWTWATAVLSRGNPCCLFLECATAIMLGPNRPHLATLACYLTQTLQHISLRARAALTLLLLQLHRNTLLPIYRSSGSGFCTKNTFPPGWPKWRQWHSLAWSVLPGCPCGSDSLVINQYFLPMSNRDGSYIVLLGKFELFHKHYKYCNLTNEKEINFCLEKNKICSRYLLQIILSPRQFN